LTRIAVDPAGAVGRLDRKVFGGFVEHLGPGHLLGFAAAAGRSGYCG
jgi:hypothetical protein